jgi:hypothetical protein
LPRGIAQDLLDHPKHLTCWCGTPFQKKAANQIHCSRKCGRLASVIRSLLPNMPPPAVKQERKTPPMPPVKWLEEGACLESKNSLGNVGLGG